MLNSSLLLYDKWIIHPPCGLIHPGAERLWQKRFDDAHGIKYYINIHQYPAVQKGFFQEERFSEAECQFTQFTRDSLVPTVDIRVWSDELDVIEATVEKLWQALGSPYYERNK